MDTKLDHSDEHLAEFSRHLRVDPRGFMVLRTQNKETRVAWAKLDPVGREMSKTLALIRVTHELQEQASAMNKKHAKPD